MSNKADVTNPSEEVRLGSFSGDPMADWRAGGCAHLFLTCKRKFERDGSFASETGRKALAELLDSFTNTPLPAEIRQLVQAALVCPRKIKPGPKPEANLVLRVQLALFPIVYDDGLGRGRRLQAWLWAREKKRPRNAAPYAIVTARGYACRHVRKWLPAFRDLTDGAISNKRSELRQGHEKRGRHELSNPFITISGRSME